MSLFGLKKAEKDTSKEKLVIRDILVARAEVVSSYNDGQGCGPMCDTLYFLVRVEEGRYRELFSDSRIATERECHHDGICTRSLDTPYIEKVFLLTKFLKRKGLNDKMTKSELFAFITHLNVLNNIGALDDMDDSDEVSEE